MIRPLRHQRVEVVDDRQDARAERDLFTLQSGRVALAVPALVMAQDQRRHRIRERHRADDVRADLRMRADLLELLGRQRPGLRQDVLGHGELADVVQQRRRLHALDFVLRHAQRARDGRGVELHAPDVRLRGLILRVDRERQRFDRRQVQVRHLAHVTLLVFDAAEVDLVGAIGQIERRRRERRDPLRGPARDHPCGESGRAGADEIARRAPQEVLVPDLEDRLVGGKRDRRRDGQRVDDEVGRRRADERLRQRPASTLDQPRRRADGRRHPPPAR